jgi:hypothetical protein
MLLLVGQPVVFLSHLQECRAFLSEREVSRNQMEITRKLSILIRFTRHNRPPGCARGGKRS